MRYLVAVLVFLLPMHALLITFLKCKVWIDTDILRFWKEFILIVLLFVSSFHLLKGKNYSIKKVYENNDLLWTLTAFILCSLVYIFFPFFQVQKFNLLGFKYDVFFFFALIAWLYLPKSKKDLDFFLKLVFASVSIILIVFLPWYLFGDIEATSSIFGYSSEVSTYNANSCISFAQNVNWQHRFQATFGGPIRFSVFLTLFYLLSVWYILNVVKNRWFMNWLFWKTSIFSKKNKNELILIIVLSIFVLPSIFLSYSKTSILWLLFWVVLFVYLIRKIIYKKKLSRRFLSYLWIATLVPLLLLLLFKMDLFLHLWSTLNRLDNLEMSFEKFRYNPIWQWLWTAGPASQIWKSIESVWSWEIAAATVDKTHKFLPENWYVQILLEQWIVWFALFVAVLLIIGFQLYGVALKKKDYFSIALFTAFVTLCFMANFTHAFEESATSYILFFIIWAYLSTKND